MKYILGDFILFYFIVENEYAYEEDHIYALIRNDNHDSEDIFLIGKVAISTGGLIFIISICNDSNQFLVLYLPLV